LIFSVQAGAQAISYKYAENSYSTNSSTITVAKQVQAEWV